VVADKRNDLFYDVAIVVLMPGITIRWGDSIIVPGLFIDTVHAKQLDFAGVDKTCHGLDHSHPLIIKIAAPGAGKNDQRFSPISVDLQGHIAIQVVAPPSMFFNVHLNVLSSTSKNSVIRQWI
jgi:hypothetical protein